MSGPETEILQNSETAIVDQEQFNIELQKYYSGHNENSKKMEWSNERIQNVLKLLDGFNIAKSRGKRPTSSQYHHAYKYDSMDVDNQQVLIMKRKTESDPVVQIVPTEEYYQRILDAHIATGHGRRDKIVQALRDKYIIPIFAITIFINLCKICLSKKSSTKSGAVVKPLVSDEFNRRGQIDIVDFQTCPDGEYKWLLQYQDHLTKFCFLRPLKSKQPKEVAVEVLKIFLEVGCPNILQSDSGREFTASVTKEIVTLWPACKIVHGKSNFLQSQGNEECLNEDIKNMIKAWMVDNKSKSWSIGCYFVQFQKNSSYDSIIARAPFKALFGVDPKLGFSSTNLSKDIISKLETEEDVERVLEEQPPTLHNSSRNNEKQCSDKDEQVKQGRVPTVKRKKIDTKTNDQEEDPIEGHEIFLPDKHLSIHKSNNEQDRTSAVSDESDIAEQATLDLIPVIHESPMSDVTYSEINIIKEELDEGLENVDLEVTSNVTEKSTASKNSNILHIDNISLKIEEILICNICNKEASVAHTCTNCKKVIHAICGEVSEDADGYFSKLFCNLCVDKCKADRTQSHIKLKRVADETIATSSKKLKDSNINPPVIVQVPKVNRRTLENRNVISNVSEQKNELYIVGTAIEIIKNWLPQNSILSAPTATLPNNMPEVTLPLSNVASISSLFGSEGVKQCNCRKSKSGKCVSNKCDCKKAKVLCNPKCHNYLICNNK